MFSKGRIGKGNNDGHTNAYGVLPVISRYAELYKEDVDDKIIVLRREGTDEIKKIPYYTRFSDGYYSSKAKEIQQLNKNERFHRGLFFTLTLNPARYFTLKDAYEALQSEWNRLRTWMMRPKKNMKRYPVKEWKGEYLAVVEFQEQSTKLPHLHVCLFGAKYADVGVIRRQWEKYMGKGTFFHVRRLKPRWWQDEKGQWYRTTAINYVLKYMWKAAQNQEHLTELWALGARAYSTSSGLLDYIIYTPKNNSNVFPGSVVEKWVYLGCFPASVAQNWSSYTDVVRDLYGDIG
ncbi:MAG: hypothetical protein C4342_02570 [Armatimonadota bacterium]